MSALAAIPVVISSCACGAEWTEEEWEQLEFVGLQRFDDGMGAPLLQYRNCQCGSTHAVWRTADGRVCDENGRAL